MVAVAAQTLRVVNSICVVALGHLLDSLFVWGASFFYRQSGLALIWFGGGQGITAGIGLIFLLLRLRRGYYSFMVRKFVRLRDVWKVRGKTVFVVRELND